MPAVTGGTGFVGFGDYVNANQQGAQQLADTVNNSGPNLNKDSLAVFNDSQTVLGQVDPYLQQQQQQAVGNDQSPANLDPTTTHKYSYSADANGPGGNEQRGESTTTTASPYAGQSQAQADYNAAGGAGAKGGNPYDIQAGTAGLVANPSQLAGYGQVQQDVTQQTQDEQKVANEGSWGGAFGALQAANKPDANGLYHNAVGTGNGFDALLAQGALSGQADAARAAIGGNADTLSGLNSQISNVAGSAQNPWASNPVRPAAAARPTNAPSPQLPPSLNPHTGASPYQGFSNPYSDDPQGPQNVNRTPAGGTY